MKNLILLILLAATCYFGWHYFKTPTTPSAPPLPTSEPAAQGPKLQVPFHFRLKMQRLIQRYEDVLLERKGRTKVSSDSEDFRREVQGIQRDLQRLKLYDRDSIYDFCMRATSEIDTDGNGNPDYAPEQATLLVDGILRVAGIR